MKLKNGIPVHRPTNVHTGSRMITDFDNAVLRSKERRSFNLPEADYLDEKLLPGTSVEVRQEETGLRGAWYAGTILKVRPCCRIVQYHELLFEDGKSRLIESIPRLEGAKEPACISSRSSLEDARGCLRPLPPSCPGLAPHRWRRGLCVDALFADAWWEGILMEDIVSPSGTLRVKVYFPDEDDEECFMLQDLRISQEWDEENDLWTVKGYRNNFGNPLVDKAEFPQAESLDENPNTKAAKRFFCCHLEAPVQEMMHNEVIEAVNNLQKKMSSGAVLSDNNLMGINSQEKGKKQAHTEVKREEWQHEHEDKPQSGAKGKEQKQQVKKKMQEELIVEKAQEQVNEEEKKQRAQVKQGKRMKHEQRKDVETVEEGVQVHWHEVEVKALVVEEERDVEDKDESEDDDDNGDDDVAEEYDELDAEEGQEEEWERGECEEEKVEKDEEEDEKEDGEETIANWIERKRLDSNANATVNKTNPYRDEEANNCQNRSSCLSLADEIDVADSLNSDLNQRFENDQEDLLLSAIENTVEQEAQKFPSNAKEHGGHHESSGSTSAASPHGKKPPYTPNKGGVLSDARSRAKKILRDSGWSIDFRTVLRRGKVCRDPYHVSPLGSHHYSLPDACREWIRQNKKKEDLNSDQFFHLRVLAEGGYACPKILLDRPATQKDRNKLLKRSNANIEKEKLCSSMHEQKGKHISKDAGANLGTKSHPKHKTKSVNAKSKTLTCRAKKKRGRPRMRLETVTRQLGNERSDATNGAPKNARKKSIISWLIDMKVIRENEEVFCRSSQGVLVLKGQVSHNGIFCHCCTTTFAMSVFQAHVGKSIYVKDGRSIIDCQMDALELLDENEKTNTFARVVDESESDDTCGICGDGGELICCDGCPSTFHLDCVMLEGVPDGDWFCSTCRCGICAEGVINQNGDSQTSVVFCYQCEKNYHVNCLHSNGLSKYGLYFDEYAFCSPICKKIFRTLRGLVGLTKSLDGGTWFTLLRSTKNDQEAKFNIENHSKLALALTVMMECFRPMVDHCTNVELIAHLLYNRGGNIGRLNYQGFYTIILGKEDEIISAATIRIHGLQVAEMPLIGTRFQYRRQGMCRRLLDAIEQMLRSIGVETLVLPAVPDLLETWTNRFGFQSLNAPLKTKLVNMNIVTFPGTTLLHKRLIEDKIKVTAKTSPGKMVKKQHAIVEKEDSCTNTVPLKRKRTSECNQQDVQLGSCVTDSVTKRRKTSQPAKGTLPEVPVSDVGLLPHSEVPIEPDTKLQTKAEKTDSCKKIHDYNNLDQLPSNSINAKLQPDQKSVQSEGGDGDSSKVVITKTRSNRLVKSSQWVADALKKLRPRISQITVAKQVIGNGQIFHCDNDDSISDDLEFSVQLEKNDIQYTELSTERSEAVSKIDPADSLAGLERPLLSPYEGGRKAGSPGLQNITAHLKQLDQANIFPSCTAMALMLLSGAANELKQLPGKCKSGN